MKLIGKLINKISILYIIDALCILGVIWTIIPTILITRYTYPVQDDFHLVTTIHNVMNQGHGIISSALIMTWDYYKNFMGAYSASFFVFVFEALIHCSQPGIMIFETCSLLLFYASMFLLVVAIVKNIFGIGFKYIPIMYFVIISWVNNVYYYADHDDFYWLDTSILYLSIMAIAFIGAWCTTNLPKYHGKKLYWVFCVLGIICSFIGSGANLCLSFMNCAIQVIISVLLWMKGEKIRIYISPVVAGLIGTFINGIAPGNYVRNGGTAGIETLFQSLYLAFRYSYERVEYYLEQPLFGVILIILFLILILFPVEYANFKYGYRLPLCAFAILFCAIAFVSFPGILGYGYECVKICMRLMFVIDCMILIACFIGTLYVSGWIKKKYVNTISSEMKRDITVVAFVIICFLFTKLRDGEWLWTPVVRMYRELNSGRYEEYSDYVWNVYNQIDSSDEKIAVVYCNELEDKSCLPNPEFCYGDHGNEAEYYYDDTIALYYGKDAVYLYNED